MRIFVILILLHLTIGYPQVPQVHGGIEDIEEFQSCLDRSDNGQGIITTRLVVRNSTNKADTNSSYSYSDLNRQWNICCGGNLTPAAYFVVRSESDIQAAIKCAGTKGSHGRRRIRLVAKGGGHSFAKYSYGDADSIIVDLRELDNIQIDPISKTVTVGAGTLLGPLNYKLWHSGKFAIPSGDCQTVGISFLLGGGHSDYSRLHGMGVDKILEMKMVTPTTGELITVNNITNPELFWALRGAGSGSFGIVTEFKLRVHNAPKAVVYGTLLYNTSEFVAGGVFQAWQRLAADGSVEKNLSRNIHSYMNVHGSRIKIYVVELLDNNNTETDTEEQQRNVKTIFDRFPPTLSNRTILRTLSYLEYICEHGQHTANRGGHGQRRLDPEDLKHITRNADDGMRAMLKVKSFYVKNLVLHEQDLHELEALIQAAPAGKSGFGMQMLGGAIDDIGSEEMAYIHRDSMYLVQYGLGIIVDQKKTEADYVFTQPMLNWAYDLWIASERMFGHTESYQNYVDPDLSGMDSLKRYYGVAGLRRLVTLKSNLDPDNMFHHPQSIPLAMLQ